MSDLPRYFIVTRDSLEEYGAADGYDSAEDAEEVLMQGVDDDLVVILGAIVPTRKTLHLKKSTQ